MTTGYRLNMQFVCTYSHSDHLSTTQLCCVNEPGNRIRDAGATALVEGLKEMKNLENLNLLCEFWMVGIPRSLTVMTPYLNAWWG